MWGRSFEGIWGTLAAVMLQMQRSQWQSDNDFADLRSDLQRELSAIWRALRRPPPEENRIRALAARRIRRGQPVWFVRPGAVAPLDGSARAVLLWAGFAEDSAAAGELVHVLIGGRASLFRRLEVGAIYVVTDSGSPTVLGDVAPGRPIRFCGPAISAEAMLVTLGTQVFVKGAGDVSGLLELERATLVLREVAGGGMDAESGPFIRRRIEGPGLKFQAVRLLPSGRVTVATGDGSGSGDGVIGVLDFDYQSGDLVSIGKTGAFIAGEGLPSGPLFRNAAGLPAPYASLPKPIPPAQRFTTRLGSGSALGLEVEIGQGEPIEP